MSADSDYLLNADFMMYYFIVLNTFNLQMMTRTGDLISLLETRTAKSIHPFDRLQRNPPLESLSDIIGDDVIGRTINSSEEAFL